MKIHIPLNLVIAKPLPKEVCRVIRKPYQVIERCEDGWYVGTSQRTEQFGTFPGNYVLPYDE
jgi:hypothetical protein